VLEPPACLPLSFNLFYPTLGQVASTGYAKSNIIGKIDGLPYGYVIDYALLPAPTDLKPLTAEQAQKLVADARAKAKAASPAPAPKAAGRR
jgi:hypothetical protein